MSPGSAGPVHFALLHNDCTWVMDEVQLMGVGASTAAQLQAFRERLGVVGSAKTVWMTATLDEDRLRTVDVTRELTRLPFVSNEPALRKRLQARKRVTKATSTVGKKTDLGPTAKEIAEAHLPGTLTLVIVNRVARAQELRALLAKDSRVEAAGLVHSRFRPADRRRIQSSVLSGSFTGVLVATQAIEAGVDISAKTLFTELAPWPSLVQRFGRLNRAGEHDDACVYWIDLDIDETELCLPYEAEQLRTARARLAGLSDAGPASLAAMPKDRESPTLPVLRRKDLIELFDTEPDLAGREHRRIALHPSHGRAGRSGRLAHPRRSSTQRGTRLICTVTSCARSRSTSSRSSRRVARYGGSTAFVRGGPRSTDCFPGSLSLSTYLSAATTRISVSRATAPMSQHRAMSLRTSRMRTPRIH